ncbi:hypothetical protein [Acinetobacter haemolyticus]|uniref:hypothetical protein n=1 Tax=Acinetobacter haemolyticus TaxID=29430 RepID=UPI0013732421|nr:hypothetical protein [Acinetobacter haemolyticus]NAS00830.1 hypothetical protein [Acinetobacter haemolyticus]
MASFNVSILFETPPIFLVVLKFFRKLKEPFVLFALSIFMVMLSFLVILNWILFDSAKKALLLLVNLAKKINSSTLSEQKKIKEQYQMEIAYKDYEKGSFWVVLSLSILMIWLKWMVQFGEVARANVHELKIKAPTHLIFLQVNGKIQKLEGIFISKTRNGYLVMINQEGVNNKAIIYSDTNIYKIETK